MDYGRKIEELKKTQWSLPIAGNMRSLLVHLVWFNIC